MGTVEREYLTALREFHKTTGNNWQVIKKGDVVGVHDDTAPRLQWKLAVVDDLVKEKDGLIRSAHISTANHKTNRPIIKLYPLEVVSNGTKEKNTDHELKPTSDNETHPRPKRTTAAKAKTRITEWTDMLHCSPEKCRE